MGEDPHKRPDPEKTDTITWNPNRVHINRRRLARKKRKQTNVHFPMLV